MTALALGGALTGLGIFLVGYGLFPPRAGLAARVLSIDARAATLLQPAPPPTRTDGVRGRLGVAAARMAAERGWTLASTRADLNVLGRTLEDHLATKTLLGVAGLLLGPAMLLLLAALGVRLPLIIPAWLALGGAVLLFIAPDMDLRKQASQARREFRRVVAAYLDWVKSCLEGGRGAPEALPAAATVGGGWALTRIRDALRTAHLTGRPPWTALGQLGNELDISELKDLAASLQLVAEDGAKIRDTLATRATSLRQRELSEIEGIAAERTQGMLVAQIPLALGFLLFLLYPAITRILEIL